MKKIIYALSVLAVAVGFGSCSKNEMQTEPLGLVVYANIENATATKVMYAEVLKGIWETGDKLVGAWNYDGDKYRKVEFDYSGMDGNNAVFTSTSTDITEGSVVNVVYAPGQEIMFSPSEEEASMEVDLSSQSGLLGNLDSASVMWTTGTVVRNGDRLELHLSFKQLSSVIRLDVTAMVPFSQTTVSAFSNVCNKLTIDFTKSVFSEAVTYGSTLGSIALTLDMKGRKFVTEYAAIPDGTYTGTAFSIWEGSTEYRFARTAGTPFKAGEYYSVAFLVNNSN